MELGLTTFAELYPAGDRPAPSAAQRLREVVEEAVTTERAGLDVYGVGEHHRKDFAASSPAVVLAAIAARTERIQLTSAVTVLSSDDPVRVYQDFATLDGLSGGRAELMAGRGSFTESFPLFGYDLADYDELFEEKLALLLRLREDAPVTWSGKFRAPLRDAVVYPRTEDRPLPVWIAVGGSPESVIRAGLLGLPLAIAIIGGQPARFAPLVDLYHRALAEGGHERQPVAVHAHGYVADTDEAAVADFYQPYALAMSTIGRERGWGPMTRAQFDALRSQSGSLFVGTPDYVAEKIAGVRDTLGLDRFMLHTSVGTLPHEKVLRTIDLLGTKVAPQLR
ncbi:LLM class flavin-dependent oxidoreductase [Nocardia amikacinitolerans]|uniref:LLM class flavin-dependent oxidoreductase n=1 Tax=Nocardia amikacinitolerans TaxID=756689 RepID=UPI000836E4EF|nr:LLM class flavin-dependent oxidoreductase [Nocardia amikacinitolerans]MCP2280198.1 putative oxidoreductase, LLM family [Nocardia amikacinitolerans]MCP2287567.1 putative oxidoreductase, LLM family [Nocardia amikacinitolerans]MCP2299469.1 putative oxidoreductase, LLM family [Nocardia amikacinitolerans]MCP2316866.1 putative oxidoreductase, LLM family [Nocardia amikacinitolerans]